MLLRSDPSTYEKLYGRDTKPVDKVAILNRVMAVVMGPRTDPEDREDTYNQEREIYLSLDPPVELPEWKEAQKTAPVVTPPPSSPGLIGSVSKVIKDAARNNKAGTQVEADAQLEMAQEYGPVETRTLKPEKGGGTVQVHKNLKTGQYELVK